MSQGASGGHRWRSSVGTASAQGSSLKTKQIVWTALAVLLGAFSLWLLAKFIGIGRPLRSQVVSIGMTYDNPVFRPTPFLLDSTRAFDELRKHDESKHQFVESNYPLGTKLEGQEVLDNLKRLSLDRKKENLLVYLNLQGGVIVQSGDKPGGVAYFLTLRAGSDTLHEGAGGQRVLVQDLLKACGQAPAANVLVLLEAGDCGPNWRAGILNRDFVAQLKKEVEQAVQEFPEKLRVIGAVSDGESAQASRQFGGGVRRSAFSHFAVQGLLGEADDWSFDPDTGTSSLGNARKRKVRTVSFDELFAYLHGQVGAWSRSHRAASQTVWRFPEVSPSLELAQIDSGKVRHAKPEPKEAETGEKASEKDLPSASKDSPKDTSAEKSEKKSADSAGAESSKPTTVESTKDSKPSDKTASDKEPSVGKVETAAADSQPMPNKDKTLEQLAFKLFDLWKQRDRARQEGLAALIAPREWRRLQLELIHVEQCLYGGDALDRVEKDLQQAKLTLGKVVEQVRLVEAQRKRPAAELVSLAFVRATDAPSPPPNAAAPPPIVDPTSATRQDPNEPSADEQKQFAELLKLAFPNEADPSRPNAIPKPVPAAPNNKSVAPITEPPQHDRLRELLVKFPQLRGRVWQEALRPIFKVALSAKGNGRALAADFLQGKSAITLAQELTKDPAGRSTLPVEAVTVLGVIAVAEASTKEQVAWTPDLGSVCGQLMDLRVRFEQFAANDMVFNALLRPSFAEAEVQLMAAERWVQVGQAERAAQALGQAESALAATRKDVEMLKRAAQLKANIAAELPDLTRWVARQQEASSQESNGAVRAVLQSLAKLAATVEKNSSAELNDLRNFANKQSESWFGLFDVIEQSTELFHLTPVEVSPTDGQPRPTGSPDLARLKEITARTNGLEQSWNEWRSVDREVELLLATNPSVEHWARLQDVLLVPWISAEKRQQLRKQLELLDQSDAVGESAKILTSAVRGDWQAFWAIETLRLAGLDATSEQALWDQFAKSLQTSTDNNELSESFAASAKLSQEIARAFEKLARHADSAATTKAARGEQFTRGVDPADVPAPGTQADFSFVKRLTDEQDELIHARAAQAARNARLGGNVVALQWASLAERWTKLSHRTNQVVPVEEPPFTLSEVENEKLFWTRGDPAEIQFALTATPRLGKKGPRPETMIRVLDADSLKVEPPKITQSPGHELEVGDDPQKITLTIQKPKSVTATESVITIVLLDKMTQLPWDVRRLTLQTPLKDQDWRIEFRAKGELADRDDSAASVRNRGVQSPDKYRTVLWLPATPRGGEPMLLQPVLIPPRDSKIPSVSIKVFELDEKGQPRSTPSGKQDNIPITHRDGRPIALNLAAARANAAPPAAAGAAPNPKPATPDPKGKDVSRGWVFEILPAGEPMPIKQQIIPRVRPPQTYFDPKDMQVTFRDRELVFEMQRRSDSEEVDPALRPEVVRVTLELPNDLDSARTDNQLIWNFNRGDKNRLVAQFDEQRLAKLKRESFVVSLNVSGWPRAFAHEIRHEKRPTEFHPEHPEIVFPSPGTVIKEGDKLPVEIQIDSQHLDSFGLDEPWQLACELVPDKRNAIPPRPLKLNVFRSLHESIELISQSETDWLLKAEVRNHRVEFDTEGLRGQFSIRTTAQPAGKQGSHVGSGDSEPVKIAIADPKHTPPKPKLTVAALAKIRPGTETDWLVPVSAADPEAGITEIAAGFDLDKDGKLGDAEIFKETTQSWTNPLDEDDRRVTLRIRSARLQDKQTGKHKLLVICKNGVGKVCEDPLVVPLEVDQARGWVVVKATNNEKGYLLFVDDSKKPWGGPFELPVGAHKFQLANDIIETRRGGPKEVVLKAEHTKDNPLSVTLDPPAQ